jgi:thiol-disulfide isomerase/thioredoxin
MSRQLFIYLIFFVLTAPVLAKELMDPMSGSPKAVGFNLEGIDGKEVSLEDYKGKFVLLNFWATWCAPCRKEMPAMSNLHNEFGGEGLEVVGVHVGPSLAGVKKFLESVPVSFTILIDKDMSLAGWGVRGLPTTFLINPEGKLVYQAVGEREWDSPEMVKFLKDLVTKYERMAETGEASENPSEYPSENNEPEKKSFFASLKETFGWPSADQCETSKLLPN